MPNRTRLAAAAKAMPSAPPASANKRLSVRSWRTMRDRRAPSAWRTASSRARAVERASSRLAMLAQAMRSTSATMAMRTMQRLRGRCGAGQRGRWPCFSRPTCARARLARFSCVSLASGKAAQYLRKQNIDVGRGLLHGDAGLQPAQDVERFGESFPCSCPSREGSARPWIAAPKHRELRRPWCRRTPPARRPQCQRPRCPVSACD